MLDKKIQIFGRLLDIDRRKGITVPCAAVVMNITYCPGVPKERVP